MPVNISYSIHPQKFLFAYPFFMLVSMRDHFLSKPTVRYCKIWKVVLYSTSKYSMAERGGSAVDFSKVVTKPLTCRYLKKIIFGQTVLANLLFKGH